MILDNLSSGGQKSFKSIEDFKTKFQLEYKTERLISIPVVKLQDYRSVPVHLTEDDIRANIKMEEGEILEERLQRWQRGRCRQSVREKGKGTHCTHMGTELKKGLKDLNETEVFFLTSIAVSGCIILEQAIFTIVQILLIRSGVETNPGPTSQTCCLAYQHFKRVKNTIEKTQNNFKSKITDDTLTKKVIEIEETGRVLEKNISFD